MRRESGGGRGKLERRNERLSAEGKGFAESAIVACFNRRSRLEVPSSTPHHHTRLSPARCFECEKSGHACRCRPGVNMHLDRFTFAASSFVPFFGLSACMLYCSLLVVPRTCSDIARARLSAASLTRLVRLYPRDNPPFLPFESFATVRVDETWTCWTKSVRAGLLTGVESCGTGTQKARGCGRDARVFVGKKRQSTQWLNVFPDASCKHAHANASALFAIFHLNPVG